VLQSAAIVQTVSAHLAVVALMDSREMATPVQVCTDDLLLVTALLLNICFMLVKYLCENDSCDNPSVVTSTYQQLSASIQFVGTKQMSLYCLCKLLIAR